MRSRIVGAFGFEVVRRENRCFLGAATSLFRVNVTRAGAPSNAYLFDRHMGVVAIIVRNIANETIPESAFLLHGRKGLFASPLDAGDRESVSTTESCKHGE